MRYRFINHPVSFTADQYAKTVSKVVDRLKGIDGVKAVYQVGNVKAPGISDLDILVIFKHRFKLLSNPVDRTNKEENYFFAHNLFGLSEEMVSEFNRYQPHFSGKLIWGEGKELIQQNKTSENADLWEQIAIEYLLKNYLVSIAQQLAGKVKLRQLLLEANATRYDLEILNEKGRLMELVEQLIVWRGKWFEKSPSQTELSSYFEEYCFEQEKLLDQLFVNHVLYIPDNTRINVARNLTIRNGDAFRTQKKGKIFRYLTQMVSWNKASRFIQKFQHVEIEVPFRVAETNSMLSQRFSFMTKAIRYNAGHVPYFTPPVSVIPFH